MDGKKEKCRPELIRIPSESILDSTMLPKIEVVTNYESKSEEDEDVETEGFLEVEKTFDWDELLYALFFGLLPSSLDILSDFRFVLFFVLSCQHFVGIAFLVDNLLTFLFFVDNLSTFSTGSPPLLTLVKRRAPLPALLTPSSSCQVSTSPSILCCKTFGRTLASLSN